MNEDEEAELAEARAMLEKYADQMLRQNKLSAQDLAELEESLAGQSMLFGPKTELDLQRILRDIKESEDGD
ncbi:MAG: hypothetical protein RL748_1931 [Pseudomonadota bacterium]|jgi:DNA-binding GntR family transcriptional regulator